MAQGTVRPPSTPHSAHACRPPPTSLHLRAAAQQTTPRCTATWRPRSCEPWRRTRWWAPPTPSRRLPPQTTAKSWGRRRCGRRAWGTTWWRAWLRAGRVGRVRGRSGQRPVSRLAADPPPSAAPPRPIRTWRPRTRSCSASWSTAWWCARSARRPLSLITSPTCSRWVAGWLDWWCGCGSACLLGPGCFGSPPAPAAALAPAATSPSPLLSSAAARAAQRQAGARHLQAARVWRCGRLAPHPHGVGGLPPGPAARPRPGAACGLPVRRPAGCLPLACLLCAAAGPALLPALACVCGPQREAASVQPQPGQPLPDASPRPRPAPGARALAAAPRR